MQTVDSVQHNIHIMNQTLLHAFRENCTFLIIELISVGVLYTVVHMYRSHRSTASVFFSVSHI